MTQPSMTRRSALGTIGTLGLFATAASLAACSQAGVPQEEASQEPPSQAVSSGDRVGTILAAMSTKQKIEQMITPSLRYGSMNAEKQMVGLTELPSEAADALAQHAYGGILLYSENIQGNEQTIRLVDAIQTANAPDESAGRVPLIISTDQEGGYSHRITNGCQMCGNMALGANGSEQDTRQAAALMAEELMALGINCDMAPDVDVNSNPENPVIGVRSFGDDAELVSTLAASFVQGLHDQGVISCAKHFPGHGNTNTDSHTGLPTVEVSLDDLRANDLVPFVATINAGVDMVMCAHIEYPAIEASAVVGKDGQRVTLPATFSQVIVGDLLRSELGYTGVVSTDSLIMDAIADHFEPVEAARMAIQAGVDVLLEPVNPAQNLTSYFAELDEYANALVALVEAGTLPIATIDAAVTRILTLKLNRAVLDAPASQPSLNERITQAKASVGSQQHHATEYAIAQRAVTLVQNSGVLPIQPEEQVFVLVPYESQVASVTYATRLLASAPTVEALCYDVTDPKKFSTAYDKALEKSTVVIVVSSLYDVADLDSATASFIDGVLEQCASQGKRSVVISSQLPYDLARFAQADALLACYYAAGITAEPTSFNGETVGWGPNLVATLCTAFGDGTPQGTLPVSVSRDGFVLFERGSGISYDEYADDYDEYY